MNTISQFNHSIDDSRDAPVSWGRFKYFTRKPGMRNPIVPLALAYAVYTDCEYQSVNIREAIRKARALGFEVSTLSAYEARQAERRWGR
ncbi:hypothetical protein [Lysobacter sp. P5_B9]